MNPKFTGPGQPFTLYGESGASCSFWGQLHTSQEIEQRGGITQELEFLPGKVDVSGTFTVKFFNEAPFLKIAEELARANAERKAFLEQYTGLPVDISDD